jgi:hypothetical protein
MSRIFPNTTTDFLRSGTVPLTAAPLTMACWFQQTGGEAIDVAVYMGDSSSNNLELWSLGATSTGPAARYQVADGSSTTNSEPASMQQDTWTQLCGASAAANDHYARRTDSASSTTASNTTSRAPSSVDRLSVGVKDDSSPDTPLNGRVGHVAIWNVALTDQDMASLGVGVSPLRMKRDNLVFYAPCNGVHSPETDIVGGRHLTINGTLARGEEPPMRSCLRTI